MIWAQDKYGGIGQNGKLPWYVPEDLKNFKSLTIDSPIIMGRKTWDSLSIKPLPKRRNIVLSHSSQKNIETYESYTDCITALKKDKIEKIFVIGGRSIYDLFYKESHFLHITYISIINSEIDEFFPITMQEINKRFKKINELQLSDKAIYTCWKDLKKND